MKYKNKNRKQKLRVRIKKRKLTHERYLKRQKKKAARKAVKVDNM